MTDTNSEVKEFDTFETANLADFKSVDGVPASVIEAASDSIDEVRPQVASGELTAEQGEDAVTDRFNEKLVEAILGDGDDDEDDDS